MDKTFDIPEHEFDEIERYLTDQMPAEEKEAFEKRLAADQRLRDATSELQLMIIGLGESALEQQLDHFHKGSNQAIQPTTRGQVVPIKRWTIAAAILGFAALAAWWLFFRQSNEEMLYARYYTPDAGLITSMSTSENYTFQKAMVDYKSGEYQKAISAWLQLAQSGTSDTLDYFLASAYLANGQLSEARPLFAKVATDSISTFNKDAAWYLGLCDLKENKTGEAKRNLQRSGRPEATEIISTIE